MCAGISELGFPVAADIHKGVAFPTILQLLIDLSHDKKLAMLAFFALFKFGKNQM